MGVLVCVISDVKGWCDTYAVSLQSFPYLHTVLPSNHDRKGWRVDIQVLMQVIVEWKVCPS